MLEMLEVRCVPLCMLETVETMPYVLDAAKGVCYRCWGLCSICWTCWRMLYSECLRLPKLAVIRGEKSPRIGVPAVFLWGKPFLPV